MMHAYGVSTAHRPQELLLSGELLVDVDLKSDDGLKVRRDMERGTRRVKSVDKSVFFRFLAPFSRFSIASTGHSR